MNYSGLTPDAPDMMEPRRATFDYSELPPDVAAAARQTAAAIKRVTGESIATIGKHLLAAKEALPHGAFQRWAEMEVGINPRSARNYMAASVFLDGKPETISLLPAKVIYDLAAPSAPQAVVAEVISSASAGAVPASDVIARQLAVAKAEAREAARLIAKKPALSEDEAKRAVARAAAEKAADRRRQKEEAEKEHEARRAAAMDRRATAEALIAAHPDAMRAIIAAAGDNSLRELLAEISAVLHLGGSAALRGGVQ